MKNSINKNYDLALLSEVCYENFDNLRKLDKNSDNYHSQYKKIIIDVLDKSELSKTQINYFMENFEVVDQEPNTSTGFSGTLFKRRNPKGDEQDYVFSTHNFQCIPNYA